MDKITGELRFLGDVEAGQEVVNPLRTMVLQTTGRARSEGRRELEVTARCEDGQQMEPFFMWEGFPVIISKPDVDRVLELYKGGATRYVKPARTRLDDNGDPLPQKPSRSLGNVSPITGFKEGTDAHIFGKLLLESKTEAEAVDAIFKILEPRGKTRGYAKAWVSYCRSKKPDIYKGK